VAVWKFLKSTLKLADIIIFKTRFKEKYKFFNYGGSNATFYKYFLCSSMARLTGTLVYVAC